MEPMLRRGRGSAGGAHGSLLLSNINLANMVNGAFRSNENAVATRMLGLKNKPAFKRSMSTIEFEIAGTLTETSALKKL
jgi:hypothetical protein